MREAQISCEILVWIIMMDGCSTGLREMMQLVYHLYIREICKYEGNIIFTAGQLWLTTRKKIHTKIK